MDQVLSFLGDFATKNPVLVLALWGVSEGLSFLPKLKANGVFQLAGQILVSLKDAVTKNVVAPPAPPK